MVVARPQQRGARPPPARGQPHAGGLRAEAAAAEQRGLGVRGAAGGEVRQPAPGRAVPVQRLRRGEAGGPASHEDS